MSIFFRYSIINAKNKKEGEMKDILGLLTLGVITIASLSLWPQAANADKKFINQNSNSILYVANR